MDLYKEFTAFAESHGFTVQGALSRIAAIRSYRPETMKPKGKKGRQTRSPYYLRWVEKVPCVFCGKRYRVHATLVKPDGTITANRASDYLAIPVCARCLDKPEKREALSVVHVGLKLRLLQSYLQCVEGT